MTAATRKFAPGWHGANYQARRDILDIVSSNHALSSQTLYLSKRKPFDLLAEGPSLVDGRLGWTTEELSRRIELFAEGAATLEPHIRQMLLAA